MNIISVPLHGSMALLLWLIEEHLKSVVVNSKLEKAGRNCEKMTSKHEIAVKLKP